MNDTSHLTNRRRYLYCSTLENWPPMRGRCLLLGRVRVQTGATVEGCTYDKPFCRGPSSLKPQAWGNLRKSEQGCTYLYIFVRKLLAYDVEFEERRMFVTKHTKCCFFRGMFSQHCCRSAWLSCYVVKINEWKRPSLDSPMACYRSSQFVFFQAMFSQHCCCHRAWLSWNLPAVMDDPPSVDLAPASLALLVLEASCGPVVGQEDIWINAAVCRGITRHIPSGGQHF